MRRLTTDNPTNSMEAALNLFYAKDGEAWVLRGGPAPDYPDVTLLDYMRQIIQEHVPRAAPTENGEELANQLDAWLFDGTENIEGLVAMFYTIGWAFAELRARLKYYEDIEAQGRLRILQHAVGATCGSCGNWNRLPGENVGTCSVRPFCHDKLGMETSLPFQPYQSHRPCKDYKLRED